MLTPINPLFNTYTDTQTPAYNAPQFSAKYAVSGEKAELAQFRNQLRHALEKKKTPYATATVNQSTQPKDEQRKLLVFTDADATTLKKAFHPQQLFNLELSRFHTLRSNYEAGLDEINEKMIRHKSTLIKEKLGDKYFKRYSDFIQGLAQARKGLNQGKLVEMEIFDRQNTPQAPQSWVEFVEQALSDLETLKVNTIFEAKTSNTTGFDYKEGQFFDRAKITAQRQSLLSQFSKQLSQLTNRRKAVEAETKKPLHQIFANKLSGFIADKQSK